MTKILVFGNQLSFNGKTYPCAIGRSGIANKEKEGDGITPIGAFPLRECWYRADKMDAPKTGLPLHIIQPDDGWCDDPKSTEYNKHVKIPSTGNPAPPQAVGTKKDGYEKLWRDDDMYDLIIPIGYNDSPIIAGAGSAIFLHVAKSEYLPTEGCVALEKVELLELLAYLDTKSVIEIRK
jgi:L,D-peptidoglycan transpeptidase YkuD (ErfK/YbiS/YcfS/YnhG family)